MCTPASLVSCEMLFSPTCSWLVFVTDLSMNIFLSRTLLSPHSHVDPSCLCSVVLAHWVELMLWLTLKQHKCEQRGFTYTKALFNHCSQLFVCRDFSHSQPRIPNLRWEILFPIHGWLSPWMQRVHWRVKSGMEFQPWKGGFGTPITCVVSRSATVLVISFDFFVWK